MKRKREDDDNDVSNSDHKRLKPLINGLHFIPDFITEDEETKFIEWIDEQNWNTELKRRTQHYGFKYAYSKKELNTSDYLGPLPSIFDDLIDRMKSFKIFSEEPQQLIINEYLPGQGISKHIDHTKFFGEPVVTISLLSDCIMTFRKPNHQKEDLLLTQRSLASLKSDARYKWTHEIPANKTFVYLGKEYTRNRRVSLTFRTVLNSAQLINNKKTKEL